MELTKENLTFALSLIGTLGTISGWCYYWITSHKNIVVKLTGYRWNKKGVLIHLSFTNKSRLPICINAISLLLNGREYFCSPIPIKVLEKTTRIGKEIVGHKEFFSMNLPLNLPSLCGDSGYLNVLFEPEIQQPAPNEVTVVIYTNRGKALKKPLLLDKVLD